ncbi:MAG: polyprenyl synthetase family protein [Bacteroidales bacterium]|nr:polyprenyl synthetase family protein [Bacteroidales bacterium]
MNNLELIKAPIKEELAKFELIFKETIKSDDFFLNTITNYVIRTKGKQVRPILVFLSAKLCGKINDNTYTAATLIELLHSATLIHDDVVDDSDHRRGFFSVKALWKNKIAVLVGDYLLSQGLLISLNNNNFAILKIVSEAVKNMSEGELMQIHKARTLDIDEEVYFQIIKKKTAVLLAACCACGCASNINDKNIEKTMYQIGENIGIAFQIKDDLLDFDINRNTGKPKNIDMKERKLTLPVIHLLKNSSLLKKRKYINYIKHFEKNPSGIDELIKEMQDKGSIEYAKEKMNFYCRQAIDLLNNFNHSEAKASFENLIKFTIERNK